MATATTRTWAATRELLKDSGARRASFEKAGRRLRAAKGGRSAMSGSVSEIKLTLQADENHV
ncbi:MAG TPA: hypothetical protein VNN73_05785 [Blastocatellia bacterium]|nr:hypothetical protein [Blastocatellia bacterium]